MLRHWIISGLIFLGTITATEKTQFESIKQDITIDTIVQLSVKSIGPILQPLTTLEMQESLKKNVIKDKAKRCPQYEELFKQYGLLPIETFSYIAWRESGCRPKAINAKFDNKGNVTWTLNKNGSIDRGLLQINSSWVTVTAKICGSELKDMEVLYNLDCNLKVGKYLLDNGGLEHWGM